jgi:cellulose biosynthesis protein BcsQ
VSTSPARRAKAARISIFNHKGGVGKTTLTLNLAAALCSLGRRVLLVDSDPQCNLTSYLVAEEVVDDLLDSSDKASGTTVWSAVKPISEASGPFKVLTPIEPGIRGLYLLPGDIRLSEFETDLSGFWGECLQRKIRGFKGTTALSELVSEVSKQHDIDYVFYDCGPNIGPLNRVILLDCDYVIVPVACDLFSLRALKTLGRTLVEWITSWKTISDLAPQDIPLLPGSPALLGYVPEGFKVYAGVIAQGPSAFLSKIDKEIHSQVVTLLRKLDPNLVVGGTQSLKLGEIKHFGALVPASQSEGVPLHQVSAGSADQRQAAQLAFSSLALKVDQKIRERAKR